MIIDEAIDAFRRGEIDIDCKRIVLCQNKEGGARFEGQGYIRQAADGTLEFKLYTIKYENIRPLDDFDARLRAVAITRTGRRLVFCPGFIGTYPTAVSS